VTEQQLDARRAIRVGDIVKTPATGGLYSDLPAIVTKKDRYVTVHTGHAELMYESSQLRPWGRIALGRSYGVAGHRRFRVCVYTGMNGKYKEVHVCVREAGAAFEIAAALEIRKLAFLKLMEAD